MIGTHNFAFQFDISCEMAWSFNKNINDKTITNIQVIKSWQHIIHNNIVCLRWSRLSEQFFRLDKWSPAGVRLPCGEAAR